MARSVKAGVAAPESFVHNPAPGTVVLAQAGGQAIVEFDFENDSPNLADYYLRVEGNPVASWTEGVGKDFVVSAEAWGKDVLRLNLQPPANAAPGEHAFQVKTMSDGQMVGKGPIPLILRVEPSLQADSSSSPSEGADTPFTAADGQPTTAPLPSSAAPKNPRRSGSSAAPAASDITSGASAFPPLPTPSSLESSDPMLSASSSASARDTPISANPQSTIGSASDAANVVSGSAQPLPAPKDLLVSSADSPPVSMQTAVVSGLSHPVLPANEPPPAPSVPNKADRPIVNTTTAPITATTYTPIANTVASPPEPPAAKEIVVPTEWMDAEEPGEIVDFQPEPSAVEPGESESPSVPIVETEPCDEDPQDGHVIKIRAGETRLLRFNRTNEGTHPRNCSIQDEDLKIGWSKRTPENFNVDGGKSGFVGLRIQPPPDAKAGEYPFTVKVGFTDVRNESMFMTLIVLPTPAVSLEAKETFVRGGPLSRYLDFALTVHSIGNCDTAFRIAVKQPNVAASASDGAAVKPRDLYETPEWRFLFDRELDTLRSKGNNPPKPIDVKLRVQRRGWWKWGWVEKQPLRVEAVPVTDVGNSGKPGNVLDLTASRRRVLPFPVVFLLPFVFLFLFVLTGTPDDLSVENALYKNPETSEYWVANMASTNANTTNRNAVDVDLHWASPLYSLLRVTDTTQEKVLHSFARGAGHQITSAPLDMGGFDKPYQYRVSQAIGSKSIGVIVHALFTRAGVPVSVPGHTLRAEEGKPGVYILDLEVRDKVEIQLFNNCPADPQHYQQLQFKVARKLPPESPFQTVREVLAGTINPQKASDPNTFKFIKNPAGQAGRPEDDFVIATSDITHPVLKVHLHSEAAKGGH